MPEQGDQSQGLYYPDGSFKSEKRIKVEAIKNGTFEWEQRHDLEAIRERNFNEWQKELRKRQASRQELLAIPDTQRINFNGKRPVTLALIGDVHAGADNCNYELFGDTVQLVKNHPDVKAVLMGDLVDAFFWNQAMQGDMLNHHEQLHYMQSALEEMDGEIIGAYKGNHSRWSEKTGVSTLYYKWIEKYGTPYFEGRGTLEIGFPERTYTMLGSHRFPGHSMYNDNHPQMRESHFGQQGMDIYVSGHTHKKSVHSQYTNVQGERIQQYYITVGPFKGHDNYGEDKGYDPFKDEQLGAVFITLDPESRDIEVDMSLEQVYKNL
jgi:UDP-2,3-diacylglucosamine pyrophosphatase LpxH